MRNTIRFVLCLFQSNSILYCHGLSFHILRFYSFELLLLNILIGCIGETIPTLTRKYLKRISTRRKIEYYAKKEISRNSIKLSLLYAIHRFISILLYSNIEAVLADTTYWVCILIVCNRICERLFSLPLRSISQYAQAHAHALLCSDKIRDDNKRKPEIDSARSIG